MCFFNTTVPFLLICNSSIWQIQIQNLPYTVFKYNRKRIRSHSNMSSFVGINWHPVNTAMTPTPSATLIILFINLLLIGSPLSAHNTIWLSSFTIVFCNSPYLLFTKKHTLSVSPHHETHAFHNTQSRFRHRHEVQSYTHLYFPLDCGM